VKRYDRGVVLKSILTVILGLSFGTACACDCKEPSVQIKRDHSDVIFRGTIIDLRNSENAAGVDPGSFHDLGNIVVFRVTQVWKGNVGQIFEMPAVEETSMCAGFWPDYIKVGTDLLVYALHWGNFGYVTGICGGHKLAKDAHKDFKALGPGKIPQPQKAQLSK
jgi:hypothetical protein